MRGEPYRLFFHPLYALVSSSNNSKLCELWHRRMAHFHHGALRSLREIVTGLPHFRIEHQGSAEGVLLGSTPRLPFPTVIVDQLGYILLGCSGVLCYFH
jgi:hypothetical protein